MSAWLAVLAAIVVASGVTGLVRLFANRLRLIDTPNERSSHSRPVPRGGGLGIFAGFGVGLALLWRDGLVSGQLAAVLALGGAAIAALGLADDRWGLQPRWRLLAQTAVAIAITPALGTTPALPLLGVELALGWFAPPLVAFYLVWAVNYFNFMDGIDGIAALEAITVCAGGALLSAWVLGASSAWVPVIAAAASGGFLVWNWPPARIFMGDVGSGFVGLLVGVFTLWFGYQEPVLVWSWFVLQGCFMVDATTTLVRRVRRGERATAAHRSHAYQYAARRLVSHRRVTLAYAAITLFWLLPLAFAIAGGWLDGLIGLVVAYAPLVALAFHWRAGATAAQVQ
jgi:Fuc2NAc and GlcNAc transferase